MWSIFRQLAKLVVVWFALATMAAAASPLIQPKRLDILCVEGGGTKFVVVDDNGKITPLGHHTLDCPSCLLAAPPPPLWLHAAQSPQAVALFISHYRAAHIAVLSGSALPPRGPPLA